MEPALAAGVSAFAQAKTQAIENAGGSGNRALIVELRDAAWKPSTG